MKFLSALRHSRGFGIHSPFAFRFITESLCLPRGVRYYAEASYPGDRAFRLVHRSVATLQPHSAFVWSEAAKTTIVDAVRLADSRIAVDDPNPELLVAEISQAPDKDVLARLQRMASEARFVITVASPHGEAAKQAAQSILDACKGMTFDNTRGMSVKVTRRDLPHQTFFVWF